MTSLRIRGRGRWFRVSALAGVVGVLGVSACGGGSDTASTETSASTSASRNDSVLTAKCPGFPSGGKAASLEAVGNTGGAIVEGHPTALETFNPLAGGTEAWEYTTQLIYDKLVDVDPNTGLLYPNLVEEVPTKQNGGISADGLTYTFKLRPGIKWADGRPFTAEDVAYEYRYLTDEKAGSPFTSDVRERIASVTAPDERTVVFKLKQVVVSFLYQNMYGIAPKHVLSTYAPAKLADSAFAKGSHAETFGTGPFRFREIKGGNTAILERNPNYLCGEPALDNYVYQATTDPTANLQLLQSGQIDVAGIATEDEDTAKGAGFDTFKYSTVFSTNLLFNLDADRPVGDQKVRQALMYGLNRDELLTAVGGYAEVTNGVISPKSFAHTEDIEPAYAPDLEKAQQLLSEAGWERGSDGKLEKDGKPLRIELWTNSDNAARPKIAAVLQEQWSKLGAQVDVKLEDFASLQQRYESSRNYDIVVMGLYHSLDPDDMTQFFAEDGGLNYNGYSNPEVDALLRRGVSTSEPEQRKEIYAQAQGIVADDVVLPALWFNGNVRAVSPRVHNVIPNGIALDVNRWNGGSWWIDPK